MRGDIKAGRLAILPYSLGKRGIAEIGFAYKRQRTPLPAARAFMSLIRRHLKQATAQADRTGAMLIARCRRQ